MEIVLKDNWPDIDSMKRQLSSRLSPQAKKAILLSPHESVTGILEVASGAAAAVRQSIESFGGKVRSAVDEANSVTFEIGAEHLAELADIDGVIYVSTHERYQT